MKIINKKAFTLIESIMVMLVCGTIGLLTIIVVKDVFEHVEKTRVKNAILEFKNGLNAVTSNPYYYPLNGDLGSLQKVVIEGSSFDKQEIYEDKSKFRGLFLKEIDANMLKAVDCYVMSQDKKGTYSRCYLGNNNTIWGVPDTDFDKTNMVSAKDPSGSIYSYLPVTIYPTANKPMSSDNFDKYAIVIGVRRDGDITLINTVDCSDSKYENYNQCRSVDLISNKKNTKG